MMIRYFISSSLQKMFLAVTCLLSCFKCLNSLHRINCFTLFFTIQFNLLFKRYYVFVAKKKLTLCIKVVQQNPIILLFQKHDLLLSLYFELDKLQSIFWCYYITKINYKKNHIKRYFILPAMIVSSNPDIINHSIISSNSLKLRERWTLDTSLLSLFCF